MNPQEAADPVVFFSNGIGDSLLALPALRALSGLFPDRMTLVCEERAHRFAYWSLPLRQVVYLEPTPGSCTPHRHHFDVGTAVGPIEQCDLFVSLVPWRSDALEELVTRLRPELTMGFFDSFDLRLPLDFTRHSFELLFTAPRSIDPALVMEDYAAPPDLPAQATEQARRVRSIFPPDARVLAVHADTSREKCWPAARFRSTLEAFLDQHPDFVVWLVGQRDEGLASEQTGSRVFPCLGTSIELAMGLVAESDAFLGIDSCMLHAADLFRIPGVGLFGPTSPQEWGFHFAPHRHVCGRGTLDAIDQADVLAALEDVVAWS